MQNLKGSLSLSLITISKWKESSLLSANRSVQMYLYFNNSNGNTSCSKNQLGLCMSQSGMKHVVAEKACIHMWVVLWHYMYTLVSRALTQIRISGLEAAFYLHTRKLLSPQTNASRIDTGTERDIEESKPATALKHTGGTNKQTKLTNKMMINIKYLLLYCDWLVMSRCHLASHSAYESVPKVSGLVYK